MALTLDGTTGISATGNIYGNNIVAGTITLNNVATPGNVSAGGNVIAGNVSVSGNVSGAYILGNGACLTGVITSVSNITNGTSNVSIGASGGNITVGVGGTAIAAFTTTGLIPAANITQDLGNTTNRWRDLYLNGNTIYLGNATISANASAIVLTNPDGGNTVLTGTTGNSELSGSIVSVTGNVVGNNVNVTNSVSAGGNVTGGNILTANNVSAGGNIYGGNISVTGSLTFASVLVHQSVLQPTSQVEIY